MNSKYFLVLICIIAMKVKAFATDTITLGEDISTSENISSFTISKYESSSQLISRKVQVTFPHDFGLVVYDAGPPSNRTVRCIKFDNDVSDPNCKPGLEIIYGGFNQNFTTLFVTSKPGCEINGTVEFFTTFE